MYNYHMWFINDYHINNYYSDILLKNYETYKDNTAFWETSHDKSSNENFIKYYLNLYYSSWGYHIKIRKGIPNVILYFNIRDTTLSEDSPYKSINTTLPTFERSLSEQIHTESFDRIIYDNLTLILNDLNNILFDNIFRFKVKSKQDNTTIIEFRTTYVNGHFTFHTHDPRKSSKYVRTAHLVHENSIHPKQYYNFIILDNKVNYIIDPVNDDINMILISIFFAVVLNLLINQSNNLLSIHNNSD